MTIELILLAPSTTLISEFEAAAPIIDVPVNVARQARELEEVVVDGTPFVLVEFTSEKSFREARAEIAKSGMDCPVVAVLQKADFDGCLNAFRAGAIDVLARPIQRPDWEEFSASLRQYVNKASHPDSIIPLNELEKIAIKRAIYACGGQVSKTSRKLGIGRSTLYRKMQYYGLSDPKDQDPG